MKSKIYLFSLIIFMFALAAFVTKMDFKSIENIVNPPTAIFYRHRAEIYTGNRCLACKAKSDLEKS